MPRIVTIIGVEGRDAATLSEEVAGRLNLADIPAQYKSLGPRDLQKAPSRRLLRIMRRRKLRSETQDGSAARATYRRSPALEAVARRFTWAASTYARLILVDYRWRLASTMRKAGTSIIVTDRYVFDVVVDIGLRLRWSPDRVVALAQSQLSLMTLPQVRIFLSEDPDDSMVRGDDLPDPDDPGVRRQHYEALAHAFGFTVLDRAGPIESNSERTLSHSIGQFGRTYVHYVHSNNEDVGGADKVLALMAAHLGAMEGGGERGFRTAVSLRSATPVLAEHAKAGTPVLLHKFVRPQLSAGPSGLMRFAWGTPATLVHFVRLFARERPSIVHVNDLYDFLPAIAARLRGIPVVYQVRTIHTNRQIRRAFAWFIPKVSVVSVCDSAAVRDCYFARARNGHSAEVIHNLGNADLMLDQGEIREPGPRPTGLPTTGRLVLMIGRFEEWKGQHVYVAAVGQIPVGLRSAHVFAMIGGSAPGREAYYERVTAEATALGIEVLGQRDDIPALLRAADVAVHCSTSPDPFPGVVIESLLAGAATVASAAGGVPEIITNSSMGILTPPGDAARLAEALRSLLASETSPRQEYARNGRARASMLVDPGRIDRQVAELYRSVERAGRHGSRSSFAGGSD